MDIEQCADKYPVNEYPAAGEWIELAVSSKIVSPQCPEEFFLRSIQASLLRR